jgi:hypothetical protein
MLTLLRSHLEAAIPGAAVLVEDEVTAALDISQFATAVNLLNGSNCQVICQIAHRLNLKDFPGARVYICSSDQANKPRMRLNWVEVTQTSYPGLESEKGFLDSFSLEEFLAGALLDSPTGLEDIPSIR